jgi:hypothetical protein
MTQIRTFVSDTACDLRGGRQSWRVFSLLCSVSFVLSVGTALIH